MGMAIGGRASGVVVAFAALGLLVGCSASRRTQSRMNVLRAENVDLIQRTQMAEQSARDAQLAQDRTLVELQQERHRATQLEGDLTDAGQRVAAGERAVMQLERSRDDNLRNAERVRALRTKIENLEALAARSKPAPTAPPGEMAYEPSPHLDAFAADLRPQLSAAGIDLSVEIRTMRDGHRRVAIVLGDAFPPGKASLSYNMKAVRAVVSLGKLIARSYPGSRISVEGHTDSDPIKVCPFPSNEALSLARAQSVKGLLVNSGVRTDLIEVAGHGARHPLEGGSTKRAKSRNRRVEIYIEPNT